MKWLQANPLGMALAATSGVFALLALVMAVVWSLPVAVQIDESGGEKIADTDSVVVADDIGPLRQYEVINQKPVFNESRLPVIEDVDDELPDDEADTDIAVAVAPDVRLTGVIITPGMKIASLTPAGANVKSVMAYEGDSLTGDFVGWQVTRVNPRTVVLESRDGQKLELELEVHDSTIKQPPKTATPAKKAIAATASPGQPPGAAKASEDEEPLSRAEQIRQRIAERREELRREQEQDQNKQSQQANTRPRRPARSNSSNAYQDAMRAKIRNQSKEKSSDDNEDG
jgi:hypothetical protein